MRRRQGLLGALLAISLLWCAIPVFAGWSWCGSDPIFYIDAGGQTVKVSVDTQMGVQEQPFDYGNVEVKLILPASASVSSVDNPDGFAVKINYDEDREGDAKLQVKVAGDSRDDCLLELVTLTVDDGAPVGAKKSSDSFWMFDFELP